jgi:hypothetical protein
MNILCRDCSGLGTHKVDYCVDAAREITTEIIRLPTGKIFFAAEHKTARATHRFVSGLILGLAGEAAKCRRSNIKRG